MRGAGWSGDAQFTRQSNFQPALCPGVQDVLYLRARQPLALPLAVESLQIPIQGFLQMPDLRPIANVI